MLAPLESTWFRNRKERGSNAIAETAMRPLREFVCIFWRPPIRHLL